MGHLSHDDRTTRPHPRTVRALAAQLLPQHAPPLDPSISFNLVECVFDSCALADQRLRSRASKPGASACTHAAGRYHRGTKISRLLFSTASSRRSTTSCGSATRRPRIGPSLDCCGNPGVSTNPGLTVWTAMPRGASSTAIDRENASWACFDAEYGPPATVPATETMFTTCDPWPRPGRKASDVQTEPR